MLKDFNFIPTKEIISIIDGVSSGLGDDTKQILQKENIDIRYSNSKKDLKWDLLHRNIRQNLVGSHIMAEFAKVPGWKILPLFDTVEGNLYLLMKEYRFNNILKTRNSTFPAQITEHCLNKYWLGCYPVVNFTFQYFCDIG